MSPISPPRPCNKHPNILLFIGQICQKCDANRKSFERKRSRKRRLDKNNSIYFYVTPRWRKLRALFIKQNPLCADCDRAGMITTAAHVDHKESIEDGGDPWDTDNLESLCKSCHSRKTMRELNARRHRG